MKKFLISCMLVVSFNSYSDQEITVADLTVKELTDIVRAILQESLQQCVVTGTMEGRAKVTLAVVGSVEAKMECNFEGLQEVQN